MMNQWNEQWRVLLAKLSSGQDSQRYKGLSGAVSRFKKRRVKFYGDFADSLEDGANPYELFARKHARAVQRKDRLAPMYALWRDRAGMGSLAAAWKGTVPKDDLMIIDAGEKANLPESLRFLSKVITVREKNRAAIMMAISLPIFLFFLMMVIQVGVALGMMPIMVQIIAVEDMPLLGQLLYGVSNFILRYWWLVYGVPIILGALFFASLPRWTGRLRTTMDRFAPYSLYRDMRSSEFLVSLAAMTAANISTYDAVTSMSKNASPWMRRHLAQMRLSLRSSRSMLAAMDTGLFSDETFDRVVEYAERSNFEQGLRKIGMATIEALAETIAERTAMLRNGLLVCVGGFIGFTVLGMLQIGQGAAEMMEAMM